MEEELVACKEKLVVARKELLIANQKLKGIVEFTEGMVVKVLIL